MSKKLVKEWFLKTPWGKLAVISWGDSYQEPVLLVHGYMDTAATFIPLMEYMPDQYFYVSFDMPGHGKSDPFLPGLAVTQIHMVEALCQVVDHMKWGNFVYVAHSMGAIISMFYNHLYPGRVTRAVHIDAGPAVAVYYFALHRPSYWHQFIDGYYSHYESFNPKTTRHLTYEEAINLMVRNRNISEDKAEAVISRAIVPVPGGKYRLSWEPRMKKVSTLALSEETLFTIMTQNIPVTLFLEASENKSIQPGRRFAADILEKCKSMVPNFYSVVVDGGHDVHITDPDVVAIHITEFLNLDSGSTFVRSKL